MMLISYFIIGAVITALLWVVKSRTALVAVASLFYVAQVATAVWIISDGIGLEQLSFFTTDPLGTLCFTLLSIVSPAVFYHSIRYLDCDKLSMFKLYNMLLVMLCMAMSATYFANNIAVTWIFIETTTLCTAGIIYHRRTQASLEATWKYIFVCSTGIAIAYLGVLLLSSIAHEGDLTYITLSNVVSGGNELYMKIAFLFVVVGYSCKMEIFPLYTIGVDANLSSPTPASALISTALVNCGFVAIYRVYGIMSHSVIFPWVRSVLIISGVASLLIGALYLRRTNNFKRLLSYSSVENMGIVAIGLGVGGVGVYAALLHVVAHTIIKSALYLQLSQVGRSFGTYRINQIGSYINVNKYAAIAILLGSLMLMAFPPSPLFLSELMILKGAVMQGQWWLLIVMVILVCVVMYGVVGQMVKLCYRENRRVLPKYKYDKMGVLWSSLLIVAVCAIGFSQPRWFAEFLNMIISMQ